MTDTLDPTRPFRAPTAAELAQWRTRTPTTYCEHAAHAGWDGTDPIGPDTRDNIATLRRRHINDRPRPDPTPPVTFTHRAWVATQLIAAHEELILHGTDPRRRIALIAAAIDRDGPWGDPATTWATVLCYVRAFTLVRPPMGRWRRP